MRRNRFRPPGAAGRPIFLYRTEPVLAHSGQRGPLQFPNPYGHPAQELTERCVNAEGLLVRPFTSTARLRRRRAHARRGGQNNRRRQTTYRIGTDQRAAGVAAASAAAGAFATGTTSSDPLVRLGGLRMIVPEVGRAQIDRLWREFRDGPLSVRVVGSARVRCDGTLQERHEIRPVASGFARA